MQNSKHQKKNWPQTIHFGKSLLWYHPGLAAEKQHRSFLLDLIKVEKVRDTVDGSEIRQSPVEVGSLSYYLPIVSTARIDPWTWWVEISILPEPARVYLNNIQLQTNPTFNVKFMEENQATITILTNGVGTQSNATYLDRTQRVSFGCLKQQFESEQLDLIIFEHKFPLKIWMTMCRKNVGMTPRKMTTLAAKLWQERHDLPLCWSTNFAELRFKCTFNMSCLFRSGGYSPWTPKTTVKPGGAGFLPFTAWPKLLNWSTLLV